MKKILTALVVATFVFSGCSIKDFISEKFTDTSNETTSDEYNENLETLQNQLEESQKRIDALEATIAEDEEAIEETEDIDIDSYITITSPANGASFFLTDPIEFHGLISPDATKIVVKAYYHNLVFSETDIVNQDMVDVYTLQNFQAGDTEFTYRASQSWNNLGFGDNTYIFTGYFEDGSTLSNSITINYEAGGMGKPVIYLYPEEETKVFVNVKPNAGLLYSDPNLGEGWNVIAKPNGLLYELSTKSFFHYLYWEGLSSPFRNYNEGFCVEKDNIKSFFEEKLAFLGLNEREMQDFFEYWEPKLNDAPYYLITFIDQKELDTIAPLTISPAPETIIRIFFDYETLEEPIEITPQQLTKGVRKGFTVIEWGGSLF